MVDGKRRFGRGLVLISVAWVAVLLGGFTIHQVASERVDSAFVRWLISTASLATSVALGRALTTRILARVHPDGEHRREAANLGADKEDAALDLVEARSTRTGHQRT